MPGSEKSDNIIKNIIFDFGGVIINIDHQKVERAFKNIGLNNFEVLFNQASQTPVFQEFEKGIISEFEFRKQIRKISGLKVEDDVLDHAWNQIIGDYPLQRINLLKKIRKNYKLFLLSNTNCIHYRYYISMFRKKFGFDFKSLFDNTYWSFQIGLRKPDPDPYVYLLNNEKLNAEETLFIDDSVQNISAAEKLNILAFHLENGRDISSLFFNDILIPGLFSK